MRLSYPQVVELIHICLHFQEIVYFVYRKYDRLPGTSEHLGNFIIRIRQPLTYIRNKNDNICGIYGYLSLLPHLGKNYIFTLRFNTAGIYHGKYASVPVHLCVNTIPGDSGGILYDRYPLSRKAVKKCGFAHIRPAYNSYNGFTHDLPPNKNNKYFPNEPD